MPPREAVTQQPYNAHTPGASLAAPLTPVGEFFVRSHFPVPDVDARAWRLRLWGGREVSYDDLLAMPHRALDVAMECAGNGRTRMVPTPPGTPWGERAVACARFEGVPFRDLAPAAPGGAVEVLFAGADEGEAHGHRLRYERSLPLAQAMHEDTLVVTRMNGNPLTPEHGAPVRLLVPGWYGVASVKWLVEARPLDRPFDGFYQAEHYVYRDPRGMPAGPVRAMRVKSIFAEPAGGAEVPAGRPVALRGWAWSGEAPVRAVEVSDDGGATWREATLTPPSSPYAWARFELAWTPPRAGAWRLLARASDAAGNAQPPEAPWNALGYGNNEVARLDLRAR